MSECEKNVEKRSFEVSPELKAWVVIEAVGKSGSVAIVIKETKLIIATENIEDEFKYSSKILPLIKKLLLNFSLTPVDITGLVLVNGPGSFTGLRVSSGLVQGLSHGLNCPVFCASSFEIYAFMWLSNQKTDLFGEDQILFDIFIDARLQEYFYGRVKCKREENKTSHNMNYQIMENSLIHRWEISLLESPTIINSSDFKLKTIDYGVRVLKCPNLDYFDLPICRGIDFHFTKKFTLSGWGALFCLSNFNNKWKKAEDIQPLYIRDKVAQTIKERRNKPSLILETFDKNDVEIIFSIESDSYKFGWTKKNFLDSLNSKYNCKKLVNNSLLVGYFIWMKAYNECHILNFTIAKGVQNRGLGQWMLSRLLKSLNKFNFDSVFLEVRPSNKSAIKLYGKNGFEIVGRRKNYYPSFDGREDALVMKRLILNSDNSLA